MYFDASELADWMPGRLEVLPFAYFASGELRGGGVLGFRDPSRNWFIFVGLPDSVTGVQLSLPSLYQDMGLALSFTCSLCRSSSYIAQKLGLGEAFFFLVEL